MKKIELKVNHLIRNTGVSYLTQYLNSLGIRTEDVGSFINKPKESDRDNPDFLDNIKEAAELLVNRMDSGAHVFVQVDSDTDGYTSSAVLINYLKRRWPDNKIVHRLHNGKEHGVILETIPDDCRLIIIPDAGSNQFDEQRMLVAGGRSIIVLDHHDVEEFEDTGAIVVNNQLSKNFSNPNLSGVGVVYMFIQYLDKYYFKDQAPIYQDYTDLTAIGIIADAMNMTSLGNNYIAYYGLRNIKSRFIYELAVHQERGIKDPNNLTKIDVAFYIAPVINGVIRSGAPEDKEAVFKALTEENSEEIIETTWRGMVRHESIYQYAVRLAANAKSRQDSAKKKSFEWLCEDIRAKGLDKDNIIVATLDEKQSLKVSPNITGLIAMELVKEFNKPALVLRKTEYDGMTMYGGSARNGNFYGLQDLKTFCQTAQVYYAEGHANAFGAFLRPDDVQRLRDFANKNLTAATFEDTVYQVDYWFKANEELDYDMLMGFARHDELWGNSIPQPKFAFSCSYNSSDIFVMGKDKTSVKIKHGNIDFVSFKNADLVEQLQAHPTGTMTVVGRPQVNEWMGNISIQIMIDDIEIGSGYSSKPSTASLLDLI